MKQLLPNDIEIQNLSNSFTCNKNFVDVLRLDKIHPIISGNKFFKLRFYIQEALNYKKSIVTFGGAHSNHIIATAYACHLNNIKCKAIIRGEKPNKPSSTITEALKFGMELIFVERANYTFIKTNFVPETDELVVPEGGCGNLGCNGAATINHFFTTKYDYIVTAVGTGTTIAGISMLNNSTLIGINVLKGNDDETIGTIKKLNTNASVNLISNYHFGGYAKKNTLLLEFMNHLYQTEQLPTDFVYTAKMFYAVHELIQQNYFKENSKILAIHTGGLQGNNSLPKDTLIF